MKVFLIDAYDSFVYILYQYLLELDAEVRVVRNDVVDADALAAWQPDFILFGPGPGHPADAHYVALFERFGGQIPMLGVCLGHQAFGLAYGARVARAEHLMHGKTSEIEHDGRGCFTSQPSPFRATRYHSLIVEEQGLPSCLQVTARARDDGYIMGLRHEALPIESVQFHPESVYTEGGMALLRGFVATHVTREA